MDRQQELDNAAEEIIAAAKNIYIIKSMSKRTEGLPKIASPYLNFRDALFHYKKMYETQDHKVRIEQQSSINEHLNRGIKDFTINLCSNYYIPLFYKILVSTNNAWARQIYHKLKNLVLEIRLAGQSLQRFDDANTDWLGRIIVIIEDINKTMNNNATLSEAYYQYKKKMASALHQELRRVRK
jgi:hemerythrin superfamily protein